MHGKDHKAEDLTFILQKNPNVAGTEKMINITASLALFE